MIQKYELPQQLRQVESVHILYDGTRIKSKKEFAPYEPIFVWVDLIKIQTLIFRLRCRVKSNKKSVIAIHENGRKIEIHENVSLDFTP